MVVVNGVPSRWYFSPLSLKADILMKFYSLVKILLSIILFLSGCTITGGKESISQPVLRHEMDEARLLTESEFMNRVRQSATIINEGLLRIEKAVTQYAADSGGRLPPWKSSDMKSRLLDGGYIERWPAIPPFAFTDQVENEFLVASCQYCLF